MVCSVSPEHPTLECTTSATSSTDSINVLLWQDQLHWNPWKWRKVELNRNNLQSDWNKSLNLVFNNGNARFPLNLLQIFVKAESKRKVKFCVSSFLFTEKPVSVELSCGAGPSHVVLEPGLRLLLECNLGATDTPFNISWFKDGQLLPLPGTDYSQYMLNQSLLLKPTSADGQPPQDVEGSYSCVSASARGALTSRSVNVLLASRCCANFRPDCLLLRLRSWRWWLCVRFRIVYWSHLIEA